MKKLLNAFVAHHHINKHMLFIDPHSMLIFFASATMVQFLFSAKQTEVIILTIRGLFLLFSFFIYVLSRAFKQHRHHDALVLIAFSTFVVYRIFLENLIATLPEINRTYYKTYWVILSLFLCTGLSLKWLLNVTAITFIGLVLELILCRQWRDWAIDIPLFFAYTFNGLILYYTFFCIGVEVCRLRHRPLRSLKDLPSTFFKDLEPNALGSLPLTVIGKSLTQEEHLYILLRITQMSAFRDAALQLIGEDSEFELSLTDTDKLERGIFRSALIQFHLKECPNPVLRSLAALIGAAISSEIPLNDATVRRKSTEAFTTRRTEDIIHQRKQSKKLGRHVHSGFAELNLFNSFGKSGAMGDTYRNPLEALASKITYSRLSSDGRTLSRKMPSLSPHHSTELSDDTESVHPQLPTHKTFLANDLFRLSSSLRTATSNFDKVLSGDGNGASQSRKLTTLNTVTVGTVTFPMIDVHRAVSQARAEQIKHNERQQKAAYSSSSATLIGKRKQTKNSSRCCYRCRKELFQRGRQNYWLSRWGRGPRNSINEVLNVRLRGYDDLLQRGKNPMRDIISVQIHNRIEILTYSWVQQFIPCLKILVTMMQGIEAVMTSAQWRHSAHIPKRGLTGRFLDVKIERWFIAWVAPVQARQHILLSPLVLLHTIVTNLVTWDLLLVENYYYSGARHLVMILLYMTLRSIVHIGVVFGLHSYQNVKSYKGPHNAHYFKRRATLTALIGLLFSVVDTSIHQIVIDSGPTAQFILLSALIFPAFSHLSTVAHLWILLGFSALMLSLLPVFAFSGPTFESIQMVLLVCIGVTIWIVFLSQVIIVNYRFLFCRYVLPYLLYLDALQPARVYPSLSHSSTSSDSSSDIDSEYSLEDGFRGTASIVNRDAQNAAADRGDGL